MWLTNNEKKVLKALVDDAKLSDTTISKKINISSQAVGRIRERLEEDIIKGYSLNLDSKILGMNIFAIIKMAFRDLENKDIIEIENEIIKVPEVLLFVKTMVGEHVIIAGFKDIEGLERFSNEKKKNCEYFNNCVIKEIIPLPLNCILKTSYKDLYNKLIDSCGTKVKKIEF